MASELTAAQVGKVGQVRRDPMAMIPFCGYNMADYFRHWLSMGTRMAKAPRIFAVNWFRMDAQGKFMWPGFGENLRILEWVLDRCENKVGAVQTPIGFVPNVYDLDMTGLSMGQEELSKLFEIRAEEWLEELRGIKQFFQTFNKDLPSELWDEYESLSRRLKAT